MLQGTSCRKKDIFLEWKFPIFSILLLLLLWIDGIFDFSNNEHGANIKRASNQSQTRRWIKVPDLNGEGKMSFYLFREKSTVTCSHEYKNRLGPSVWQPHSYKKRCNNMHRKLRALLVHLLSLSLLAWYSNENILRNVNVTSNSRRVIVLMLNKSWPYMFHYVRLWRILWVFNHEKLFNMGGNLFCTYVLHSTHIRLLNICRAIKCYTTATYTLN